MNLAPCPFCGGEVHVQAWTPHEDIQYYAGCPSCGLKTDDFDYEADLVSYWNAHVSLWQRLVLVCRKLITWLAQETPCTATQLAPCPFCGSERVGDGGLWRHVIKCHDCGARSIPCSNWNEAVDAWNARALSPEQLHADELFEALDYVLTQLKLAFMGFGNINIDANKLQELYDSVVGKEDDDTD